jgi:putative nucleotidyltransferase with HDIG domain
MAACEDPDADPQEISAIIQCDPSMAIRLLHVANSSAYGFSSEISTIDQAIVVLGFRSARNLVLSVAAAEVFAGGETAKEARANLWEHSLGCAAAARLLAAQVGTVSPEEAFLAAIVHDVGKLIFYDFADADYLVATQNVDSSSIINVETEAFGTNHQELGQRCADQWGLPLEIADVIAFHHIPEAAAPGDQLTGLVCVANSLAHALGLGGSKDPHEDPAVALQRCSITIGSDALEEICQSVRQEFETIRQACSG